MATNILRFKMTWVFLFVALMLVSEKEHRQPSQLSYMSSTNCPVDPLLPETAPGNSYECPDLLPDGTPNDYNNCCHNDRPDSEGNFHSCCQSEEEKSEAKMGKFYLICGYIGIVTAAVMTSVFAYTYCRDDTFPCLKPIRRRVKKHFDRALDAVCFCSFLPKKIRRRGKKDDIPEEPKKPRVNPKYNNDPSQMDVPDDQFWA